MLLLIDLIAHEDWVVVNQGLLMLQDLLNLLDRKRSLKALSAIKQADLVA